MEEPVEKSISTEAETLTEVVVNKVEPVLNQPKVIFKLMKVGDNCALLNVRKEPSLESEVIAKINSGATINVNLDKSTSDFFYVASEVIDSEHKKPIHGYCKKDFLV
jgi:uncharacterized protein YgiM (DUF1202 family)